MLEIVSFGVVVLIATAVKFRRHPFPGVLRSNAPRQPLKAYLRAKD